MVEVFRNNQDLKRIRAELKGSVGFVPTMGFLHRGHTSLIERSAAENSYTFVSIFVNPQQFGPNEDLASYPKDEMGDVEKSVEAGATHIWIPTVEDIYPPGWQTSVVPGSLSKKLCGSSRPQFFPGICSVVLRLFQLVKPDRSYFGEKDYQQFLIIRQMAKDFFLNVEVVGCPLIRDPDGLAMSSRNARLNAGDRETALHLFRTIRKAQKAFQHGQTDANTLRNELWKSWPDAIEPDYLDFRRISDLELVDQLEEETRIFIAGWLNGVRLIDNASISEEVDIY